MPTTFNPSAPVYQGRVGGYPGGATFTDPTKIYLLSPLTVHWIEGDQTYTFGSGFAIPPPSTGGNTFFVTLSDVGRTGTATISVDSDATKWKQDGGDYACLGIVQVYTTPSGFAFSVFGASGPNHSTGLVPDPGSSAGTTKFLREDASFAVPVIAAGSVTEADLLIADNTTANVSATKHGFAPKSPADATQFLNGAATPAFAAVKDSDLSTSDITTNNVSISKHGFAPKAPNDGTKFLDGTGAYSTPAGGVSGSGTANKIAKFTGSTAIGNSNISDDGTTVSLQYKTGGAIDILNNAGTVVAQLIDDGFGALRFQILNGNNLTIGDSLSVPADVGLAVSGPFNRIRFVNSFGTVLSIFSKNIFAASNCAFGNEAQSNTDNAGQLTLVSGTASYSFQGTFTNPPIVVVTSLAATPLTPVVTVTHTTLTITVPGGTNTDTYNYIAWPQG